MQRGKGGNENCPAEMVIPHSLFMSTVCNLTQHNLINCISCPKTICKSEMLLWGLENPRPFVIPFVSGAWPGSPLPLVGVAFARYILVGCWKNLIDTLSTPLTGRMAGSSKGLAFILGAEGIKEQNQKERDAICMSLDGLRKAARLSCALGTCGDFWPEGRSLQNSLGKPSFRRGSFWYLSGEHT